MREVYRFALILAVAVAGIPRAVADEPASARPLDQVRALEARGEFQKAVALLEDALPESSNRDRADLIEALRRSYRGLIKQAEAAGKSAEAASYRENLEILDPAGTKALSAPSPVRREPAAVPPLEAPSNTPAPAPDPAVSSTAPAVLRPLPRTQLPLDPAPAQEPSEDAKADVPPALAGPAPSIPESPPLITPMPATQPNAGPLPEGKPQPPEIKSRMVPPTGQAFAGSELIQADQLFNAKKYEAAGTVYARLAAANQLPMKRRQVWAYCRWVAVVARINAPPSDSREWDAIEQEIRSIQRLTPGNWYGEYLQNRVSEARRGSRTSGRPGRLVVRGSDPEESPGLASAPSSGRSPRGATAPSQGRNNLAPAQPLSLPTDSVPEDPARGRSVEPPPDSNGPSHASPGAQPAADSLPLGHAGGANLLAPAPQAWQVRESANFRIYHMDQALAEKASVAAESVRAQQARRWGSSAARYRWTPPCEIYLYPTPRDFAESTGQPETSPGFSTMSINGTKVSSRRVNLRADHPQLLSAILPHEVTHVILADMFTQQQIPRWADEGMAVLSEPLAEQMNRAGDLNRPLQEGRTLKLNELMAIDSPNAEDWSLYYAQSVSLTQYLVGLGTPDQFIRFVRSAQRGGVELALREIYRISDFNDLETRWQLFAKRQVAELAAATPGTEGAPDPARRR